MALGFSALASIEEPTIGGKRLGELILRKCKEIMNLSDSKRQRPGTAGWIGSERQTDLRARAPVPAEGGSATSDSRSECHQPPEPPSALLPAFSADGQTGDGEGGARNPGRFFILVALVARSLEYVSMVICSPGLGRYGPG
jgi:hypothetical protein